MSQKVTSNSEVVDILLETIDENPELWETRKKVATLFFADELYLEAADILWGAPEIPSTDTDFAFTLQILSRVKPNRAIRLVYEVLKRNHGKPEKNMAVARALNEVGLYMEAARFYGAALADNPQLFDLSFEHQMLWMDDSKKMFQEWKHSEAVKTAPLNVKSQSLDGGSLMTPEVRQDETPAAPAAPSIVQLTPSNPVQNENMLVPASPTEPLGVAQPASVNPQPAVLNTQPVEPAVATNVPAAALVTPAASVAPATPAATQVPAAAPAVAPAPAGLQTQEIPAGQKPKLNLPVSDAAPKSVKLKFD